jgi:hypothetical protein
MKITERGIAKKRDAKQKSIEELQSNILPFCQSIQDACNNIASA